MIQYPAGLPCALRESYGFEPVNNIIRTRMVSGRARQRISFSSVPATVPLSWIFSQRQALLFESWAAQVAKSDWFLMDLKTTSGFQKVEVRFTETPKGPELIGVNSWRFTASCELRERPLLAPGWAEIMPDWVLHMSTFDLAVNREWPLSRYQINMDAFDYGVNQEWPQP
ncbi:hypothetical protein UIA24_20540 [Pseudomonas sp. AL 58]|uniref:hypothetical protein n=1 Tax=Pseudomonas sp. AL 58 TaxID=3104275 RepID=UPI002EC512A6|nr:hypothetical protein [Pseudomonas sp. AL 58]